ncbi:hypothetical protein LTR95_008732 [Oleoguttula sp. CCFEE 5521]
MTVELSGSRVITAFTDYVLVSKPKVKMRVSTVCSVLLSALASFATAAQPERTVDIFAWPLSAAKPQALTKIAYNSTTATVKTYKTPLISADEQIVRIGFFHPDSSTSWNGIATSASNLAPAKDKTLQILLNTDGVIYHVGFAAFESPVASRSGAKGDGLRVEVVPMRPGPVVHMNKPVVLDAEGKLADKEPEKTFLQKYWWAIGIFLVLQLVMAGSKE